MRLDEIGLAGDGRVAGRDGLAQPPPAGQDEAETGVRLQQLRVERDCRAAAALRLVEAIEIGVGVGEVEMRGCEIRRQRDGPTQRCHGLGRLADRVAGGPAQEMQVRHGGVEGQATLGRRERVAGFTEGEVGAGEVGPGADMLGLDAHRDLQALHRLDVAAEAKVQQAREVQGVAMPRLAREQGVVERLGLGVSAGALMVEGHKEGFVDREHGVVADTDRV